MTIHEATPDELRDWDARTVEVPGGNVYQSRAWGEQRARIGWRPRYLAFEDGFRLLSLERAWRLVGGSGAYLSRGPISAAEPVERTAERLVSAAAYLADHGVDVVASDAEIPAASGYGTLIRAAGFRPIEEVQPSRHRVALALEPGVAEEAVFRGFATSVRQRVRHAERSGLRALRWDVRGATDPGPGFETPPPSESPAPGDRGTAAAPAFDRFYDLLVATAARRGFGLGSRASFVDWSCAGLAAGHVVYLEVRSPDDELLGGATFYRHGGRLTYSHSGDRVDLRHTHPGSSTSSCGGRSSWRSATGSGRWTSPGWTCPGCAGSRSKGRRCTGCTPSSVPSGPAGSSSPGTTSGSSARSATGSVG